MLQIKNSKEVPTAQCQHYFESDSMESRHLLFGEGSSSEGRNVEFKPQLLCGGLMEDMYVEC